MSLSVEIRITIHEIINAISLKKAGHYQHSAIQFLIDFAFLDQFQREMQITRHK